MGIGEGGEHQADLAAGNHAQTNAEAIEALAGHGEP